MSFCIYVKCFDDNVYAPCLVTYTAKNENDDVGQIFVDRLEEIVQEIYLLQEEKIEQLDPQRI